MMPVIPTVVSEHAEEAAFQWLLRDAAVGDPHFSLQDLAQLDDRVEAHIDGLRIAGDAGWEIAKEELAWQEPGEVFTLAVLAIESGDALRIGEAIEAGLNNVELSRGVISALAWLPHDQVLRHVNHLVQSDSPSPKRMGIAAAAARRLVWVEQAIRESLGSDDPLLRSRAAKAAGELGLHTLLISLRPFLRDDDEVVRFHAAAAAALLGDMVSVNILRWIAETGGPCAERACVLAMRRSPPELALHWQEQLTGNTERLRMAVIAAGALGDPVLVPWIIEQMANEEVARSAGEALTMITGVDLAYEDLEGEGPEGFEGGPTDNPEDEDVAMDPDEDLPWPAPELIGRWWSENQGRFTAGTRHLAGRPITKESLQEVLKIGLQRQRAAAAVELAMLEASTPLYETRARGDLQKKALGL